jgi:hypothetical protein
VSSKKLVVCGDGISNVVCGIEILTHPIHHHKNQSNPNIIRRLIFMKSMASFMISTSSDGSFWDSSDTLASPYVVASPPTGLCRVRDELAIIRYYETACVS